jgi:hypothetical protein
MKRLVAFLRAGPPFSDARAFAQRHREVGSPACQLARDYSVIGDRCMDSVYCLFVHPHPVFELGRSGSR